VGLNTAHCTTRDFINCVAIGKRGDFAAKYFKKGQQVAVVGRLSVREYDGQDGKRHWFTEIVAAEQHFAESNGGGGQPTPPDDDYYTGGAVSDELVDEDELPF
jgi:single-strand DNA-binding protein